MWKNKKVYIIAGIVLLIVGGIWWWSARSNVKKTDTTYTIKRKNLREVLSLSGEIGAEEKAILHFQSGGRLVWVGVKEGDTVKKYQAIASLDQRQLQKTLQKYLNTYQIQRDTFDQSSDDNDQLTLALSEDVRNRAKRLMGQGQAALDNSVIDVELQSIAKEYATLISPIDGIVTHVGVQNAGTNVAITDSYEVVNPATLYFSVSADQTEVNKLHTGQEGTITLDAFPDDAISGTVKLISFVPKENETGTVYEVKVDIEPSENMYRLAMTGDVEFILATRKNALGVPPEYILNENGKSYVFVQNGSKSVKREVKQGKEFDSDIEILQGVNEGDVLTLPPA